MLQLVKFFMVIKVAMFAFVFITFFSCNTREKKVNLVINPKKEVVINNLAGKVYFFAPKLDTLQCKSYGECDCCASTILFLDNTNFLTIYHCESDEEIVKGTYQIKSDKVYLEYDTLKVVKEYNWEKEADTTGTVKEEYFIKTLNSESSKSILKYLMCKEQVCLQTEDEEKLYGTLNTETTLQEELQKLKDLGIWDKLK